MTRSRTRIHTPMTPMTPTTPMTAMPAPAHALRTGFPAPAGRIRLVVDLNRCQSYAQCCFLAPGVFKLHGEEALWYDPAPDAAQCEHVLRAAAACPVQAIVVEWSAAASRRNRREIRGTA